MKEKYNDYVTFDVCSPECIALINSLCPKATYPNKLKCMQCSGTTENRQKIISTCPSGMHHCVETICNKLPP